MCSCIWQVHQLVASLNVFCDNYNEMLLKCYRSCCCCCCFLVALVSYMPLHMYYCCGMNVQCVYVALALLQCRCLLLLLLFVGVSWSSQACYGSGHWRLANNNWRPNTYTHTHMQASDNAATAATGGMFKQTSVAVQLASVSTLA